MVLKLHQIVTTNVNEHGGLQMVSYMDTAKSCPGDFEAVRHILPDPEIPVAVDELIMCRH